MSRILKFGSLECLDENLREVLRDGYVALIPAGASHETDIELVLDGLVQSGCKEFCFTGNFAEDLHDKVDSFLEKEMLLQIATTACPDELEAIDYFLYGAGGGESDMLALVNGWPSLKIEILQMLSLTEGAIVVVQ